MLGVEVKSDDPIRLILQNELMKRLRANPRYSLRAFARFLGIDPSQLSKILNGKRNLGAETRKRVMDKLQLSVNNTSVSQATTEQRYQQLALDQYHVIADWYHRGILELIQTDGFQTSSKWVATRLGIREAEVKLAVSRLQRLGLLETDASENWVLKENYEQKLDSLSSDASMRRLNKQLLKRAQVGIDEVSEDRRFETSTTFAIEAGELPRIQRKIEELRGLLSRCAGTENKPDEVYHFVCSVFPAISNEATN